MYYSCLKSPSLENEIARNKISQKMVRQEYNKSIKRDFSLINFDSIFDNDSDVLGVLESIYQDGFTLALYFGIAGLLLFFLYKVFEKYLNRHDIQAAYEVGINGWNKDAQPPRYRKDIRLGNRMD